jgi:CO/xanthine dehydrogenase FAD-binding subunit
MAIPDIELHEPATVAEACALLREYGRAARILAGGTDLLVDLKRKRVSGVEHLISIRNIAELRTIDETPGHLRIGTLVTPNQAGRNAVVRKLFPTLADAVNVMASFPIRNMATIGGNIASAVPCSDFAPFFLVSGGSAVLSDGESERVAGIDGFFVGPRQTICGPREMVTHLLVPKPGPRTGSAYFKFMLRATNGVAVAGAAAEVVLEGRNPGTVARCRIVLTAVAPTPVLAREAGEFLAGKTPADETLRKAAALSRKAAIPITDIRGSKEYRLELVEVLARRALEKALSRARGVN